MSENRASPSPVVEAQYDPEKLRSSLANNRRAGRIAVVGGGVLTAGALLGGNRRDLLPGWVSALVFVLLTLAVLLYLFQMRRAVYRLTTNPHAIGSVTALAISPTGLRMSVGREVPWAAIDSVHLIRLGRRLAFSVGYAAGQAIAPAMMASIGSGRTHVFVLLRDGKAFADALDDATQARRVRLWPGRTPVPGDVTVLLDPIAPDAEVQEVVDALVLACTRFAVPLHTYERGAAAVRGVARAAAGA